jgi:hypothetical protein
MPLVATAYIPSNTPLKRYKAAIPDVSLVGTVVKAALLTASYTPDKENHKLWSDVSASEIAAGNGYTAGGYTLVNKAVTEAAKVTKFTADSPQWVTATIDAGFMVIYEVSTGIILNVQNFNGHLIGTNGTVTVLVPAGGWETNTVA